LSSAEKIKLTQTARSIAIKLGRSEIPIVLGCSAGCTRVVIDQTVEAKAAGAGAALVLVPSYFHFAMDSDAILDFFQEVADASPIPILIYNYPNIVAGLDIDSEMLETLGKHKNIVGVKLTCGGIAKVSRVAACFENSQFCALAGQSDWLVPALSIGATGCISGLANLFPKVQYTSLSTHTLLSVRC
jgi:4-hydroxy-2-oxoglutarate aldolase